MNIYDVANNMKLERKTIFDLEIRVTFYARVSTAKEEQENSIENQIAFFTEMIKGNENWTYVEGYVDRVRGEQAENRLQFMNMIEDGKNGKFDLILTKEVSRFARNTIDSLTYTRELLRAGVGVFFQNDNLCTLDTDSELRLTIMSSIAADEVRKMSERIRWGHKKSIENGTVMGNSRIFGYDKDNCRLVINEKEAEMVRLIFELYATGKHSGRTLEKELYDRGYRNRNGKKLYRSTLTNIIQNPKYKGYFCGNKVRIVDYRTKEQKFLPEEEWIMYKDETGEKVPAIVSEELWNKCNRILKERSEMVKTRDHSIKNKSVFTGKIFCAAHGCSYWRTSYSNSKSKGNSIYVWICREKKINSAKDCASFSILENELFSLLSDYFKKTAVNIEDYVNTFLKIYADTDISSDVQKQIVALKAKRDKEKAKREKLLDLYTDGTISKEEFAERNTSVNILINELNENISEMENSFKSEKEYVKEIKSVEKYFKTMYRPESEMTQEQLEAMIETIIDRIDVVPINEDSMKLLIHLKVGTTDDLTYVTKRRKNSRRSEHISKKMISAYKQGLNG